jgi:hypothetical protein
MAGRPPTRAQARWRSRVAVVILRARVYAHVPCRREVHLEAVQLRDQFLAHPPLPALRPAPSLPAAAPSPPSATLPRDGYRTLKSLPACPTVPCPLVGEGGLLLLTRAKDVLAMLAVRRDSQERALAVQRQPRGGASLARNRDGVARKCVRGGAFARQFQAGVCTWWRKKATLLANEARTLRTAERFSVSNAQGIDVRTRTVRIVRSRSRPSRSSGPVSSGPHRPIFVAAGRHRLIGSRPAPVSDPA